jgi:prepilin-type N-terminal cleavage/methylation domain-containing protein
MKSQSKHFKIILKGGQGMTLIEVVVSIALLAIVSVVLVSVMTEALSVLMATHKRSSAAMTVAASMEAARAASSANGASGYMIVNGSSVPGTYETVTNSDGVTYNEFVPAAPTN